MLMVSWSKEGLGAQVQATMLILRKGPTEVWRVALAESTHIALNFTSTNRECSFLFLQRGSRDKKDAHFSSLPRTGNRRSSDIV